ncbi:MAG: hypothetical protein ACK54L_11615, partial [Betaproteobacteria bacterium]
MLAPLMTIELPPAALVSRGAPQAELAAAGANKVTPAGAESGLSVKPTAVTALALRLVMLMVKVTGSPARAVA